MNAKDAFNLNFVGRTKLQDGREVVVYEDSNYRHAVLAGHWDHYGFAATDDEEERADNYADWNRDSEQWVDDLSAIEAAWNLSAVYIHSANGCGVLDATTEGACAAIAAEHRGEHYTSPAFARDAERVNWDNVWPVVDRDGELTGRITDGDGHYNVADVAMIEQDEARDGGWSFDAVGGYATPPKAAPPDRPRWITTAAQADEFLAGHHSVRLDYRRTRGGWVAVVAGSRVRPLPHGPMRRRVDLERTLAQRYLAEVYDDHASVYLKWARALPNWANNSGLGALPELARAIEQAERDKARSTVTA
jgi:hypothetical protein